MFVKSTDVNKLSFYSYALSGSDIVFQKVYDTSTNLAPALIGSPEVYFWPKLQVLLAREQDGFRWASYKVTSTDAGLIVGAGLTKKFSFGGEISFPPIFFEDYIVVYAKITGVTGGVL